jgi:hypothetical protein
MSPISRSGFTSLALVLLVLVGGVGSVTAQNGSQTNPEWGVDLFESMESMVDDYNAHADSVDLGPVSLAGATNVYVTDGDEQATYTIYMDSDHRITDLQQGTDPDAARKMTTSRATIDRIASADNPAAAFRSAVESDDIVINGESGEVVEQIKWTVINVLKGFFL